MFFAKSNPHPRTALGLTAAWLLGLAFASNADATTPVRKTAPEPAATLLLPPGKRLPLTSQLVDVTGIANELPLRQVVNRAEEAKGKER